MDLQIKSILKNNLQHGMKTAVDKTILVFLLAGQICLFKTFPVFDSYKINDEAENSIFIEASRPVELNDTILNKKNEEAKPHQNHQLLLPQLELLTSSLSNTKFDLRAITILKQVKIFKSPKCFRFESGLRGPPIA